MLRWLLGSPMLFWYICRQIFCYLCASAANFCCDSIYVPELAKVTLIFAIIDTKTGEKTFSCKCICKLHCGFVSIVFSQHITILFGSVGHGDSNRYPLALKSFPIITAFQTGALTHWHFNYKL